MSMLNFEFWYIQAGRWQNQVVERRRETFWDGARPYHATKWHRIIYDRNSGQFLSCGNCIKLNFIGNCSKSDLLNGDLREDVDGMEGVQDMWAASVDHSVLYVKLATSHHD
ncbi:hypothetical protein BC629DRAFT_1434119 [Irpex lacteus]|nr:hypothetical protein BC629DRAFT_1434119 [Irpex lacteus]